MLGVEGAKISGDDTPVHTNRRSNSHDHTPRSRKRVVFAKKHLATSAHAHRHDGQPKSKRGLNRPGVARGKLSRGRALRINMLVSPHVAPLPCETKRFSHQYTVRFANRRAIPGAKIDLDPSDFS